MSDDDYQEPEGFEDIDMGCKVVAFSMPGLMDEVNRVAGHLDATEIEPHYRDIMLVGLFEHLVRMRLRRHGREDMLQTISLTRLDDGRRRFQVDHAPACTDSDFERWLLT